MFNLVCHGMYRPEWGELFIDVKPFIKSKVTSDEINHTVESTVKIDIFKKTQPL